MPEHKSEKSAKTCQICHKGGSKIELFPSAILRQALLEFVKKRYPQWSADGFICAEDLRSVRYDYFQSLLKEERGELSAIEEEVIASLRDQNTLTTDFNKQYLTELKFGERLADQIAEFGGSWKFIIIFGVVIFVWMFVNTFLLVAKPFDPYPYILLNLVLSCLAALQAPIIMMSQNRQEDRDRLRAENDYKINLKAELEIRHLHQKIDHLLSHQWERMVEIQEMQMELIEEFRKQSDRKN